MCVCVCVKLLTFCRGAFPQGHLIGRSFCKHIWQDPMGWISYARGGRLCETLHHPILAIRRLEWHWIATVILCFPEFKIFSVDSRYLPRSTDTIALTFSLIFQFNQNMDCRRETTETSSKSESIESCSWSLCRYRESRSDWDQKSHCPLIEDLVRAYQMNVNSFNSYHNSVWFVLLVSILQKETKASDFARITQLIQWWSWD